MGLAAKRHANKERKRAAKATKAAKKDAAAACRSEAEAIGGDSLSLLQTHNDNLIDVVTEQQPSSLSSTTRSSMWSHYLVLDFEATCDRNDPTQKSWSEIIEWPCVLLDVSTLETVGEFRSFVRPTGRPNLTEFCTELTSITQPQVDGAPTLDEVLKLFNKWLPNVLGTEDLSRVLPITCGEPDLSSMLPRECARKQLPMPRVLTRYCNVKKPFAELLCAKAGGMSAMLRRLNLPLVGHHHSGIDDARNIARIVARIALLGAEIDATSVLA